MKLLEPIEDVTSLHELTLRLGETSLEHGEELLRSMRWMVVEFPQMGADERARLHEKLVEFQRELADRIEPLVESRREADTLAWIVYGALFGYGQLFITLDLAAYTEPVGRDYINTLAEIMSHVGR